MHDTEDGECSGLQIHAKRQEMQQKRSSLSLTSGRSSFLPSPLNAIRDSCRISSREKKDTADLSDVDERAGEEEGGEESCAMDCS